MESAFYIAFIIGLTSSLHCIGMCGPIVAAVPLNRSSKWTALFGILQYHFGRIFIYALLGFILGNVGLSIQTFGWMQGLSVFAGIFLIFFAWKKYIRFSFQPVFLTKFTFFLSRNLGRLMRSKSHFKLIGLGMINGLLPCGMVFFALANALLTNSIWQSSFAMVLFGLGTLPALLTWGFLVNTFTASLRVKINRFLPIILTALGILIVLRGLNLDIPYVSPKVTAKKELKQGKHIEISCCESKTICADSVSIEK